MDSLRPERSAIAGAQVAIARAQVAIAVNLIAIHDMRFAIAVELCATQIHAVGRGCLD